MVATWPQVATAAGERRLRRALCNGVAAQFPCTASPWPEYWAAGSVPALEPLPYLLEGKPHEAERHLAVLTMICGNARCEEHVELARAIAQYKATSARACRAHWNVRAAAPSAGRASAMESPVNGPNVSFRVFPRSVDLFADMPA